MKFQLLGDWPVGQHTIPASTVIEVIDGRANWNGVPLPLWPIGQHSIPVGAPAHDGCSPNWNGVELPMKPPINALALDEEAYAALTQAYPDQFHRLQRPALTPKA